MKRVIGIYLAAGKSSRMGTDKLQLPAGGAKLGNFALLAAIESQLERIIVVTNKQSIPSWIHPCFLKEPIRARWNLAGCEKADQGQAYSLRCGLKAANVYKPDAVMILLADQPCITAGMLDNLLLCYAASSASYVASCNTDVLQPPIIIGKERFAELASLSGDEGARRLLRGRSDGIAVPFQDPKLFYDADTEEDYRLLLPHLHFAGTTADAGLQNILQTEEGNHEFAADEASFVFPTSKQDR